MIDKSFLDRNLSSFFNSKEVVKPILEGRIFLSDRLLLFDELALGLF